jgi:hypothetical protein
MASEFSIAHREFVGSASGGPEQGGHIDGEFSLIVCIIVIGVSVDHRCV